MMNKHSVTKRRTAKPSPRTVSRKPASRKENARAAVRTPEPGHGRKVAAINRNSKPLAAGPASAVPADARATDAIQANANALNSIGSALHTHKFRVGQTVFYTSSPITRPGASGSYKVVRLLPSDGEDYQYRIKNSGEAFERVAKESQLELEG
jgi:hypothetical protein